MIEKYYSRIKLQRLAELLCVPLARAEQEICDMVVAKLVQAKINRMDGIVVFKKEKQEVNTNKKLQEWNTNIAHTLEKIEYTCHLIDREKIKQKK